MKKIFEVIVSVEKEIIKLVEAQTKEQAIEWVVNQAKMHHDCRRILSANAEESKD